MPGVQKFWLQNNSLYTFPLKTKLSWEYLKKFILDSVMECGASGWRAAGEDRCAETDGASVHDR